jgi:iron(III) transport system permease protein
MHRWAGWLNPTQCSTWFLLILLGFAVLWPLISFEMEGLKAGVSGYLWALQDPGLVLVLVNTLILAFGSLVVALAFGTALAWAALHLPARVRLLGMVIPLVPLLVPSIASVIGWIFLLSPRVGYLNQLLRATGLFGDISTGPLDVYTFSGMIFISGLLFSSFIYMFVVTALAHTDGAYEEAAAVSGASRFRIFMTVTLPLLRPSLAYGGGIVFMLALGQFSVPVLLRGPSGIEVLSTRMFSLLDQSPIPFAEIALLGIPLLLMGLLTVAMQKLIVGDTRRYVTVGGRAQSNPRRATWLAFFLILVFALLAIVLPLLALGYTSLSPFWSGRMRFDNLTLGNFSAVFSNQHLVAAIYTSVISALVAILVILPIGYALARVVAQRVSIGEIPKRILEILLILPFAVPATLFGFALLFAYSGPPFMLYGTRTIIIVAYCTAMIPYAVRLLTANLLALGSEPWEASMVSGAGPLRTFIRITIPLMRKAASATAAIVFILLLQEFAISLLVRSANTQVIGSVLYDQYMGGSYPNVAVLALVMVAVTALGVTMMLASGGVDALRKAGRRVT